MLGIDVPNASVGRDDPRGHQVIAGEPRPVGVVAHAATEDEPAGADRQARAGRGARSHCRSLASNTCWLRAAPSVTATPAARVEVHAGHETEIEHQPVGHREPGVTVAAASDDRRHAVGTGPVHARDHVAFADALRDGDRLDPVIAGVRGGHRDVVRGVPGKQQATPQRSPQFVEGALGRRARSPPGRARTASEPPQRTGGTARQHQPPRRARDLVWRARSFHHLHRGHHPQVLVGEHVAMLDEPAREVDEVRHEFQ